MKTLNTILLTAAMCVIGTTALAQLTIHAGLGLAFGTTAEAVGIQIRGDVDLDDQPWGGSLVFVSYFGAATAPSNIEDVKAVYRETNLNGHYFFDLTESAEVYGLAGLNITTAGAKIKVNSTFFPNINETTTQVGFNVGGGARFPLQENIALAGEVRYILGKFDQLVIGVSGLYEF